MKDIFSEVNKQLKESKERWVEIDRVAKALTTSLDNNVLTEDNKQMAKLLLLLVDQLRPLQDSMGQAEDMQSEITDMLTQIAKMARK